MKARSITQPKDTMIESIMQGLSEKLEEAGSQIENLILSGDIASATETLREFTTALEDLAWQSYLTTLFNCKMLLQSLRILGGKKGLRLVSYQEVQITLPSGTKILIITDLGVRFFFGFFLENSIRIFIIIDLLLFSRF